MVAVVPIPEGVTVMRKILFAALALGFGVAAVAQPPTRSNSTTATTTSTSSGESTATTASTGRDLVRAELDDLGEFIDGLVEEFQIEFQDEEQARMFVLAATHFYLSAKLSASAPPGPRSGGKR
jgi:hypothetical protein